MFTEVQIENYKSIQSLKINLGRVNVFIGENGCGKSNILEAIALAGAAAGNKLDNEFLYSRGIRVTDPEFMRSAFDKGNITKAIQIKLKIAQKNVLHFVVQHDNKPYSNWMQTGFIYKDFVSWISHGSTLGYENLAQTLNKIEDTHSLEKLLKRLARLLEPSTDREILDDVVKTFLFQIKDKYGQDRSTIKNFIIYSPENSSLRIFEKEGQIQPLGIHGEGLFKLLKVLDNIEDKINTIKEKLELIDWFNDFQTPNSNLERNIQIRDRYIDKELPYFNQRSSNEGFLFLMFYFALFVSESTPKFFAIDNIENALNPKLCGSSGFEG